MKLKTYLLLVRWIHKIINQCRCKSKLIQTKLNKTFKKI